MGHINITGFTYGTRSTKHTQPSTTSNTTWATFTHTQTHIRASGTCSTVRLLSSIIHLSFDESVVRTASPSQDEKRSQQHDPSIYGQSTKEPSPLPLEPTTSNPPTHNTLLHERWASFGRAKAITHISDTDTIAIKYLFIALESTRCVGLVLDGNIVMRDRLSSRIRLMSCGCPSAFPPPAFHIIAMFHTRIHSKRSKSSSSRK